MEVRYAATTKQKERSASVALNNVQVTPIRTLPCTHIVRAKMLSVSAWCLLLQLMLLYSAAAAGLLLALRQRHDYS